MAPTEGRVARPDGGGAAVAVPPVIEKTQTALCSLIVTSLLGSRGMSECLSDCAN